MKRNRALTADLTPLLDVIFILLFLILITNTEATKQARAEADEAVEEARMQAEELAAQREALDAEIAEYGAILDGAAIIRIGIRSEEEPKRSLTLSYGAAGQTYTYDWDTMPEAEAFLKEELAGQVRAQETDAPCFIIFAYDPAKIYWSDYQMVVGCLDAFGRSAGVYVQYRDSSRLGEAR